MNESIRQFASQVIDAEATAVRQVLGAIDDTFERAVRMIHDCSASVLTCGIGKAGHVARKISATLASTGTPSHFLDPAEALHGDVGAIRSGDIVVVFSASGETDEILRTLSVVKKLRHPVIGITCRRSSTLAKVCDVVLDLGRIEEACPLGLAPSSTTTAMLALGDALALTVMKLRNFSADDFSLFHPAGQLGRTLLKVVEAMTFHAGHNLPLSSDRATVGQVLADRAALGQRLDERERRLRLPGAIVLTDPESGLLSGIFTDGDLRRLVMSSTTGTIDLQCPIRDVMTRNPQHIPATALASEAMGLMRQFRIDDLPVVDTDHKPVGLIDVQDLVVLKMFDVEPQP